MSLERYSDALNSVFDNFVFHVSRKRKITYIGVLYSLEVSKIISVLITALKSEAEFSFFTLFFQCCGNYQLRRIKSEISARKFHTFQ